MINQGFRPQSLIDAYAAAAGHIAFIDESYLAPGAVPDSRVAPFYLMAAYVLPRTDLSEVREDLPLLTGSHYWHSTQAHQSEGGRARIRDLAGYIAEGDDGLIVSIRVPVEPGDTGGENARAACFGALLRALELGVLGQPIAVAVFEERRFMSQRNADSRIVTRARREGLISRRLRVVPASPSGENLLWLPDLLAFAMYQYRVGGKHDYSRAFRQRVVQVRV